MKKFIALGISVAVVVGLIASGTWALFSDTETSEDNTFTAGTIDLVIAPTDGQAVTGVDDVQVEFKPCETGYLTITLTPASDPESNPMHVWKHIKTIEEADRGEGALPDAEQAWYDANNSGQPKNDIDRYIHFDMSINECEIIPESEGWLLSTNTTDTGGFDPAPINTTDNGVACKWIYLGVLSADPSGDGIDDSVDEMVVEQSFHMDAVVDNWAQGDVLTFDEEFYAVQWVANETPTPPGDTPEELPGHAVSDGIPICPP